jgi:trehalose synthase
VVASNVGGIPLQLVDGVNGYLVEPRDLPGCADRVLRLLNDPDLARDMGRKGRELIRHNYLITRLLSDWLDMLTSILT